MIDELKRIPAWGWLMIGLVLVGVILALRAGAKPSTGTAASDQLAAGTGGTLDSTTQNPDMLAIEQELNAIAQELNAHQAPSTGTAGGIGPPLPGGQSFGGSSLLRYLESLGLNTSQIPTAYGGTLSGSNYQTEFQLLISEAQRGSISVQQALADWESYLSGGRIAPSQSPVAPPSGGRVAPTSSYLSGFHSYPIGTTAGIGYPHLGSAPVLSLPGGNFGNATPLPGIIEPAPGFHAWPIGTTAGY